MELYKLTLKEYVEMSRKIKQETKKLYRVVLGQCTKVVINKLKALNEYEKMNNKEDCAKLLTKIIRNIRYLLDEKEDPFVSVVASASKLYKLTQGRENLTQYYDTWSNMSEVVKIKGGGFINKKLVKVTLREEGTPGGANVITKIDADKPLDEAELRRYKGAKVKATEQYLAALFIKGLSNSKYSRLKTDLANQFMWGNNNYPVTLADAMIWA